MNKFRSYEDGGIGWDDSIYLRVNSIIKKTILLTDVGIIAQKTEERYKVNVLDIVEE